jgi:hypothetical protein
MKDQITNGANFGWKHLVETYRYLLAIYYSNSRLARLFKDTTMNHHGRRQPWLLYPLWGLRIWQQRGEGKEQTWPMLSKNWTQLQLQLPSVNITPAQAPTANDGPPCWMNMRTPTKRTRGTENPDAFIPLNMQIVRVAHFSLITQVERQLCIVNRGYAIVTEQEWGDRMNKFRSTL